MMEAINSDPSKSVVFETHIPDVFPMHGLKPLIKPRIQL